MVSTRLTQAGAAYQEPCNDIARIVRDYTIDGAVSKVRAPRGNAIYFDGSSSIRRYVPGAYFQHESDPFTIIVEFNIESLAAQRYLLSCRRSDTAAGWFLRVETTGQIVFGIGQDGGDKFSFFSESGVVEAGADCFLAITYDGGDDASGIAMRLNGSPIAANATENDGSAAIDYGDVELCIGADRNDANQVLGWMSIVAFFPWDMSAVESDSIYDGSAFGYSRIIHDNYDIGGDLTYSPFTDTQLDNIANNLKSDGSTSLGLTTLQINDFKTRWGIA